MENNEEETFDFGAKRKKKSKKSKESKANPDDQQNNADTPLSLENVNKVQYQELLARLYEHMKEEKRDVDADKTVKMIVPDVQREGSKKIRICNLSAICKRLQRNIEHVKEFIYAELSTSGSVDGKEQLILKGKFGQKQIEIVLKKYIHEYASCWGCHSIDTNMVKENRMSFVSCNGCQSKRCVTAIKSGFKAQVTKRKLLAK